ncbi:MAG: UpxY family transcription antiterminator [Bacteroidetes bacterium]|nr:UpxY family transcription antiterminator [Bacteroidota bacterium]
MKNSKTIADNTRRWHAVYVSSRAEKKISETLNGKGIEAYVPIVKTMRQWSDRKKMVELPLLNGYVFIKINTLENDKVMQTKGVVNFVRSEGKIAAIRDVEIDSLKQLVALGYHIEANGINKEYKEGDKVKITSGVLKGIEGYVVEVDENKQIEVLLESIGQCIRVKLPKDLLIPLK